MTWTPSPSTIVLATMIVVRLQTVTASESRPRKPGVVTMAIKRIVDAECQASGSPKPADYERFDRFPLTDNEARTT